MAHMSLSVFSSNWELGNCGDLAFCEHKGASLKTSPKHFFLTLAVVGFRHVGKLEIFNLYFVPLS